MARYTVLRMMIFFGFLCALWLLGLQGAGQRWWLLGLSAFGSMVVSYFVLQEPRAQFSASIAHRVEEHARRAEPAGGRESAENSEDSEVGKIGKDSEVGEIGKDSEVGKGGERSAGA